MSKFLLMLTNTERTSSAIRAALFHFLGSLLVAALAAALVLRVWFPHPYDLLSGGRSLFLILVGVDVVCGPLLTLVLFNPVLDTSAAGFGGGSDRRAGRAGNGRGIAGRSA